MRQAPVCRFWLWMFLISRKAGQLMPCTRTRTEGAAGLVALHAWTAERVGGRRGSTRHGMRIYSLMHNLSPGIYLYPSLDFLQMWTAVNEKRDTSGKESLCRCEGKDLDGINRERCLQNFWENSKRGRREEWSKRWIEKGLLCEIAFSQFERQLWRWGYGKSNGFQSNTCRRQRGGHGACWSHKSSVF